MKFKKTATQILTGKRDDMRESFRKTWEKQYKDKVESHAMNLSHHRKEVEDEM